MSPPLPNGSQEGVFFFIFEKKQPKTTQKKQQKNTQTNKQTLEVFISEQHFENREQNHFITNASILMGFAAFER